MTIYYILLDDFFLLLKLDFVFYLKEILFGNKGCK